jgi:hypothetical protein
MAKYEVVRPWFGVKVGEVVELKELHPALKSNVRLMNGEAGGELNPRRLMPVPVRNLAKRLSRLVLLNWESSSKATWALKSSVSCCLMASSKSFSLLNNSRR